MAEATSGGFLAGPRASIEKPRGPSPDQLAIIAQVGPENDFWFVAVLDRPNPGGSDAMRFALDAQKAAIRIRMAVRFVPGRYDEDWMESFVRGFLQAATKASFHIDEARLRASMVVSRRDRWQELEMQVPADAFP